ncbi:MAG: transporter substrate-binding domain-containing protein [Synergistaceae bacterium]|nr:transporter substrate-binding domain-containing protein [Synergistaceae bacterium]
MNRKKIYALFAIAVMLVSSCAAYAEGVKLGLLAPARETLEGKVREDINRMLVWSLRKTEHGFDDTTRRFYDNLATMLMALNAGEIDEFNLPQTIAEYVVGVNPEFTITCAERVTGASIAFGFRAEDGEALQKKFNDALSGMKADGTLDALILKYCGNPGHDKLDSVRLEKLPDAETVRVAVTGDMPPVDFVAADGEPAGFNTAILSEIGRRAGINIEPVYVETAARTAALMSGRVSVVFWYQFLKGAESQADAPEGVIFSEPYYNWNVFLHVGLKK